MNAEGAPPEGTRTILEEIASQKRGEVERLKEKEPAEKLKERAAAAPPARDFKAALDSDGLSLIAEIKRASPSAGVIREDFKPPEIAKAYERAGARALSVLTDARYFQGSLDDLKAARKACSLPVLRKDFMIDEAQLYEARAAGADAVLLIARLLGEDDLARLVQVSKELGMATLVEVHERCELAKTLASGTGIVGVNNRDLATFKTDIENTMKLADEIPDEMTLVSESGIRTREDLRRLGSAGVDAVLIGEAFMRAPDVEAAVKEMFGA